MAWYWWLIIILAIALVVIGVVLYFLGKKASVKKDEQEKLAAEYSQTLTLLIIDKKKMKLRDAGLPEQVLAQVPKYMRGSKTPIVKVKAGPQILTLICKPEIFDDLPVKKEIKAEVSGLYLTAIKGQHGKKTTAAPKRKKSLMDKAREKAGV
ncbi:MAG: hypothetical protein K6A30_00315 [Lachnospiraceae bacterium]|nr:hypothetical protein [Lachnospiraceae bacterium]